MRNAECRVLALLVALALPWPALAAGSTASADDPIDDGYLLLYRSDVDGAYRHFDALVRRAPDDLAATFGRLFALALRTDLDETLEPQFEREIDQFIERVEARRAKSASDASAHFYAAQAYLLRSRYRLEHDKGMFVMARDAAKAKNLGEAYVAGHPDHGDAYLSLGIYNYYVDLAPTFFKWFRFLLWLPGGNRTQGIAQIEKAATQGRLFTFLARMQLVEIHGFLEAKPDRALRIARELQRQYPDAPEVTMRTAQLHMTPAFEAHDTAADAFQTLAARADRGDPLCQGQIRHRALLGLASARQAQWRLDETIAAATRVIDAKPNRPGWLLPQALLVRGNARAFLNDPDAMDDARRVLGDPQGRGVRRAAERQVKFIEARRGTMEAEVFLALVPANRLAAARRWDEARQAYEQLQRRYPDDW